MAFLEQICIQVFGNDKSKSFPYILIKSSEVLLFTYGILSHEINKVVVCLKVIGKYVAT